MRRVAEIGRERQIERCELRGDAGDDGLQRRQLQRAPIHRLRGDVIQLPRRRDIDAGQTQPRLTVERTLLVDEGVGRGEQRAPGQRGRDHARAARQFAKELSLGGHFGAHVFLSSELEQCAGHG